MCQLSKKGDINIKLNKLEDFSLKLVIPFIRILHLPRGPYLKVKGDLIMMSSEITESLNKILPLKPDIIGVAFRRRLSYKGHFIEEFVDKNKIRAYFNFFKKYNHLYEEFTFDSEALEKFEEEAMKKANEDIPTEEDEEDEEDIQVDPGKALHALKSLIVNKYREDTNRNTVVSKFADMVVQLEQLHDEDNVEDEEQLDPEDEYFPEDEVNVLGKPS